MTEPPPEPPFTIKVDGKVVQEVRTTRWAAQEAVDFHRQRHPRSKVEAFDRYGRPVHWVDLGPPGGREG